MSSNSSSSVFAGDPAVDASILQQMAYKSRYTETINKQMRVPETIVVAESTDDFTSDHRFEPQSMNLNKNPALNMEVPDRIVVSVGESGAKFGKGERDFAEEMQSNQINPPPLALQTPPRVLTLQDRNLDCLGIDASNSKAKDGVEETSSSLVRPADLNLISEHDNRVTLRSGNSPSAVPSPKNIFENLQCESKKFYREVLSKLNVLRQDDAELEIRGNELTSTIQSLSENVDDITLLKNEVLRLHQRVMELEERKQRQSSFEYCFYGITVGFWLFNAWFLFSHRRFY